MNAPADTSLSPAPPVPDILHEPLAQRKVNDRTLTWGLLAGLALLSLGLRLYCLDCYGFWGDEIASLEGARLGVGVIFGERFGGFYLQTPLHYLLIWLTTLIADPATTEFFARLPSAVAGALTPLVVYGLGREMFGRPQGLMAALLTVLAPVSLNYSQDLRPYSLLLFLTVLQVYALLMAERTGNGRWWVAFAAATIINLLSAYVALTLVLPALAPYLLWVIWKARPRAGRKQPLAIVVAALLSIGVATLAMFIDMMQVPRISPDLGRFETTDVIFFVRDLLNWFAQAALGNGWERTLQIGLLLLAMAGLIAGARHGKSSAVALCVLFIVVPAAILAVLSTTNTVFQRYALFALPFYFLLVANGVAFLWTIAEQATKSRPRAILKGLAAGVGGSIVALFLVGAINFLTPQGHAELAYRPDFRSAAAYLSQHTQEDDMVIFIDYPALGYTISDFYLQRAPLTAAMFDARDPRLASQSPTGNHYWVVSAEDPQVLSKAIAKSGWAEVVKLDGVAILQEPGSGNVLESLEQMTSTLEGAGFPNQSISTLRGSILQGRGKATDAAILYRGAGTYFSFGSEVLSTSVGFHERGDDKRAWREAVLSKFWQPQHPEVHLWLAQKLQEDGYEAESKIEQQIAAILGQGR